jgi:putative protease
MPYELLADGKVVDLGHRHYLLSPQDLASLDVLPDLIRLGVASFKIEGRLKSPEYVAAITRVYRQAVDRVMEEIGRNGDSAGKNPASPGVAEASVLAELHREHDYTMEMAFSRGLYSGWFRGTNNQELVHANFGTKRGVYLGDVTRMGADLVVVRLAAPLKPGDGIVFDAGCPEEKEEGGRVYQVEPDGAGTVLRFGTGDIDFRRVHSGDRLWKTSDPALEKRIRQTFEGGKIRFRRPVRIEAQGRAGTPLTVTMDDRVGHAVTAASAVPLEKARTQPLTADRLREQLGRLGGTPFRLGEFVSRVEGEVMLSLSELNRLRRTLVAELDQRRAQPLRWSLTAAPAESDLGAMDSAAGTPAPASPGAPELIVLIRRPDQLEAAWSAGARTIYCEFEDPKRYRDAVRRFRELQTADPASAGPMETNQGLARDIQTNPVGAVGACLPVRRVRWAHRKQAQGPEPFRQAQGPERVEGLVEGQAIPPLHPPSPSLRRTGREHLSAVASSEGGSSLLQLHESAQGLQQGSPPSTIWVALPRIFKPGEEWVLQQALSSGADGYLARNYDHLAFFRGQRMRGDYSLNVANPLAAAYFLKRYGLERVTASYDLNVAQLEALLHSAPPAWFEITIHQHMPMFHMEHCVACAFLTTGRDYRDCGRPCDRLDIRLRDRIGAGFPVKADAGCRNTVFNNRAQTGAEYVSRVLALGARAFRVEFLDENPEELQRTVRSYRQLLRGEITGAALWREFKLINQLGVTRGQMEAAAPVLTRKS